MVLVLVLLALVLIIIGLFGSLVIIQRRQLAALVTVLSTEQRIDELTRQTILRMRDVALARTVQQ